MRIVITRSMRHIPWSPSPSHWLLVMERAQLGIILFSYRLCFALRAFYRGILLLDPHFQLDTLHPISVFAVCLLPPFLPIHFYLLSLPLPWFFLGHIGNDGRIPIDLHDAVLATTNHQPSCDVYPKAHALMPLENLHHLPALHIPQHKAPVLAGRRDEGELGTVPPARAKAAADGEALVAVALVGLLDGAGDVVPQADAVVQREGEDEARVGREADVGDARVVLVDEGAEALAR